jgi:hypothetical protein
MNEKDDMWLEEEREKERKIRTKQMRENEKGTSVNKKREKYREHE